MKKILEWIYLKLWCANEDHCIELKACPIRKKMRKERQEFRKQWLKSNLRLLK